MLKLTKGDIERGFEIKGECERYIPSKLVGRHKGLHNFTAKDPCYEQTRHSASTRPPEHVFKISISYVGFGTSGLGLL